VGKVGVGHGGHGDQKMIFQAAVIRFSHELSIECLAEGFKYIFWNEQRLFKTKRSLERRQEISFTEAPGADDLQNVGVLLDLRWKRREGRGDFHDLHGGLIQHPMP